MAFLVFAIAFGAACWAIWATVAPQAGRIAELLAYGPARPAPAPVPVTVRGGPQRGVAMRTATPQPVPLRAAA